MPNAGARSKVHFVNLQEQRVPRPSKNIHCAIIYSYAKVNLGKTNLKKKMTLPSCCVLLGPFPQQIHTLNNDFLS